MSQENKSGLGRKIMRAGFFWWKCTTNRLTLGARVIAQLPDKRVVMVRHVYEPGWHFPGGAVDFGETVEAGAARELWEETGLRPDGPMTLFGCYHNAKLWRGDHVHLFTCSIADMSPARIPAREIAEVGTFSLDDLPQETTAATRRRIAEVLHGEPVSQEW